jgi:hypothetical protein
MIKVFEAMGDNGGLVIVRKLEGHCFECNILKDCLMFCAFECEYTCPVFCKDCLNKFDKGHVSLSTSKNYVGDEGCK